MIPPLSPEEYLRIVPSWAREIHPLKIPHVVGLPVYDVLYGGKYGSAKGIVVAVREYPDDNWCTQHLGVLSMETSGCLSSHGSAGAYWVADLETTEGMQHLLRWRTGEMLLDFPLPQWAMDYEEKSRASADEARKFLRNVVKSNK